MILSEIDRAVWSYWSRPMAGGFGSGWLDSRHHLLSWVLSVETARRHFGTTALVTDSAGAELLVERLGLSFDEVSVSLDALADADPAWWATGKLMAYRQQREPFLHIDSDVYLWSRPPDRLMTAPVLGQNIELFRPGASYYEPEFIESALGDQGWLPNEWRAARDAGRSPLGAVCCGIVGGVDTPFLRHYAGQAIELLTRGENAALLRPVDSPAAHVILVEQFLLWACLDFHQGNPASRFREVRAEYLFSSEAEAYHGSALSPYTHLIGSAKRNPLIADRLERRIRRQHPAAWKRVGQMVTTPAA